jgi:hypothetical protein
MKKKSLKEEKNGELLQTNHRIDDGKKKNGDTELINNVYLCNLANEK